MVLYIHGSDGSNSEVFQFQQLAVQLLTQNFIFSTFQDLKLSFLRTFHDQTDFPGPSRAWKIQDLPGPGKSRKKSRTSKMCENCEP